MRLYQKAIHALFKLQLNLYVVAGILLYLFLTAGCSSEKSTPLNVVYHNTTARFNAYYIGLERIKEIENGIWKSMTPDFDHTLWVLPPLDSTMSTTYAIQIEDCIKKASMVLQFHKNSKWIDDSYNLIGQARMYDYDFPNAIETFKYVNGSGESDNAKHWALINLMRTFIENKDYDNAIAVSDYLNKQLLNKENLKKLFITRAYYYQIREDNNQMVQNLISAVPLLTKKDNRARYYFIIGQVYQELNFESAAYEYYRKCILSNPEYELSFYAKLYMAQVAQQGESRDIKSVRKYFKKLIKDEKNIDFKDKIYFELGKFELKQNNLNEALESFVLSVQTSINNPKQKGLSYLKMGEIYYDTLANYEMAQAYYDSAVQELPQTYEDYEAVKKRSEVLDSFVEQLNIIQLEDSLVSLSGLDSTTLMKVFVEIASTNLEAKKKELAAKEKKANTNKSSTITAFGTEPTGVTKSNWYFSSLSAVNRGRSDFQRIWDSRPLEDNWRRAYKSSQQISEDTDSDNITNNNISDTPKEELSDNEIISSNAKEMFASVPRTEEEINESLVKIEDAQFKLGNIYFFDLLEKENALSTFNTLISRFPESTYKPEVLYQMYLIYTELNDPLAIEAKKSLKEQFPESTYAKLIDNPNYREESNQDNEKLMIVYAKAYKLFNYGKYDTAKLAINDGLKNYPNVPYVANMALLGVLIKGKTGPIAQYQLALEGFITKYPKSTLIEYAETLLKASKEYRSNLVKLKAAKYSKLLNDEHFFVSASINFEHHVDSLKQFSEANFSELLLKTGTLELDSTTKLLVTRSFKNKDDALLFIDTIKAEALLSDSIFYNFVITKRNFEILYESKELDTYKIFYEENY